MILLQSLLLSSFAFSEVAPSEPKSIPTSVEGVVEEIFKETAPPTSAPKEVKKESTPHIEPKSSFWSGHLCYLTNEKGVPAQVTDLEKILGEKVVDASGKKACIFSEETKEKDKDEVVKAYNGINQFYACKSVAQRADITKCLTSSAGIFERVQIPGSKFYGWKDTSKGGKIWIIPRKDVPLKPEGLTQFQAQLYCAELGGVLPTAEDYRSAEKAGIRDVIGLTENQKENVVYLRTSSSHQGRPGFFMALEVDDEEPKKNADKNSKQKETKDTKVEKPEKRGVVDYLSGYDTIQNTKHKPIPGENPKTAVNNSVKLSAACVVKN